MAVATPSPSRADEIRLIWTENQWLYIVTGFLGGVLFCLLTQLSLQNLPQLIADLLPEAAGILVTVTVIDVLNRRRDERNAIKQLQQQLVRDTSSTSNEIAKNAVHQLMKRRWLQGDKGLLAGIDLRRANLQEANLVGANLQGANLKWAYLQGADLRLAKFQNAELDEAHLQGANLKGASLEGVKLGRANLQAAKLWDAKLQGSDLVMAKLQGAELVNAKLQGADLYWANLESVDFGQWDWMAQFDVTTRLPDGTHWTPDADLTKFTHPKTDSTPD